MNNHCSAISRIFLWGALFKVSHDTIPLTAYGFDMIYSRENYPNNDYYYYYYKHMIPHLFISGVAGLYIGIGIRELLKAEN